MYSVTLDVSAALPVLDASAPAGFAAVLEGAGAVYAPRLYIAEAANALWNYVRAGQFDEARAAGLHQKAVALVDRFVTDDDLFPEALSAACQARHPVYDMLYIVTARRTASALLTRDRRLSALAQKLGVPLAAVK